MLSGFNTNVRHRGVRFHVQTEDSGLAHPHVITHLYYQGTILASEKRDYAGRVGAQELTRELKGLMEAQHAAMVERLRRGELDAVIEQRLGSELFGPAAAPAAAKPADAREAPHAPRPDPAACSPQPTTRARPSASAGERPLDELILDYLVESARSRKRRAQ